MKKEYQGKLGEYVLGKKLGVGQYSKVRVGTKAGVKYAVKYLPKSSDLLQNKTCLDLVFNEAKIMLQLDHPNIVKLFEFDDKGAIVKASGKIAPVLYLVFELITGGEIFDYIATGGRFSDKLAKYYFKQLIASLEHLYSKGYAHRDIKAENILLDDKSNLKLADFGFAALMAGKDGSGKMHSQKGTLGYMAPEIISGQSYIGEKVDLFAVGVLLFTMVAAHPPFRKAVAQDPFYKLFCTNNEVFWTKMSANKPPGIYSPTFKSLINSLLAFNPTNRATMATIKTHLWFNEPTLTLEQVQAEFAERRIKVEKEWKEKAFEAEAKKKLKTEQSKVTTAAFGGMAPHVAVKGSKGSLGVEATAKTASKRILQEYNVIIIVDVEIA